MNPLSEQRLLLIETSGRVGQIGLADGHALLAQRQLDQARRHARDLAPALRDLLGSQGWRPTDISAVIASRGPGSYTGLRVGLMAAKAFAYAVGCPVVGIDTFLVVALQAGRGASVEVIADAQQQRVYAQRFSLNNTSGLPFAETPIRVLEFRQWLDQLPPDLRVSGPGLDTFFAQVRREQLVPTALWHPTLESLYRLALERLRAGEFDDVWGLEPIYVRPSSAEEQWVKLGRE
jgi:tRNA threonylcarbamoyladenosine biosynthesis protein TsaB